MRMIDRGAYAPSLRDERVAGPRIGTSRRGGMLFLVSVAVLLSIVGVIWSTYNQGVREGGRDAPPRIAALPEPYKVAPDDPGGARTEHLGVRVFDVIEGPVVAVSSNYEEALPEDAAHRAGNDEAIAEWEVVEPHGADAIATARRQDMHVDPGTAIVPRLKPLPPEPVEVAAGDAPRGPRTLATASDANRRYFARREPMFIAEPEPEDGAATPAQAAAPAPLTPAVVAATDPPAQVEVAAVTPVAPPPAATAAPPAAGPFLVQVASFTSREAANAGWAEFSDAFEDMLAGYTPDVAQADLGDRGVRYRLRVGLFPDRAAASTFCDNVKARGRECLVVGA